MFKFPGEIHCVEKKYCGKTYAVSKQTRLIIDSLDRTVHLVGILAVLMLSRSLLPLRGASVWCLFGGVAHCHVHFSPHSFFAHASLGKSSVFNSFSFTNSCLLFFHIVHHVNIISRVLSFLRTLPLRDFFQIYN